MNKKKLGPKIIFGSFIVVICLSWLWWFLLEKFVDSSSYENRYLAEKPQLTVDNYKIFPSEFEAYFNDHLPFRNYLIKMNNCLDYFIFRRSSYEYVIIGKNDWLFYKGSQYISLADYQALNILPESQLRAIAQNCIKIQTFLEAQGKEFVIFIAPNKERMYSENMPEIYGKPADTYRALQIVEYLRENTDIRVVYPYDELMEAKSNLQENIYYKVDTHWNKIGGYVGAQALLHELGIDMPDVTSEKITITSEPGHPGDLAAMLNLTDVLNTDYEYSVTGYNEHNMEVVQWDSNVFIYHAEDTDPRKIFVYRDSFSIAMADYIGSQFKNSYFIIKNSYSYDNLVEQDPDIFVYETVERYIGGLKTFSIN